MTISRDDSSLQPIFEHTQSGLASLAIIGVIAASIIAGVVVATRRSPVPIPVYQLGFGLALLVIVAALFGSLTIRVDAERLAWKFGIGLVHRSVLLAEIADVAQEHVSPLWGFGVRRSPRGWLYNVSGSTALRIRLHSGEELLLGTDRPAELLAAILRGAPSGSPPGRSTASPAP